MPDTTVPDTARAEPGGPSALTRARQILAGGITEAAARAPGRAFGCFPVYSPFELFHAAGLLPLGLFGAGGSIEITRADARFQSFVCSIAKSTLELGLQEKLTGLQGVVFHDICDVARNLASVFQRNFPRLRIEYIHLPQHAPGPEAEAYCVAEYRRVIEELRRWTGRPVNDAAVAASLRLYNRSRALMRRLEEIRVRHPERLGAAEMAPLVRAGALMDPADHVALLETALAEIGARGGRRMDRVGVVVEGAFCEQPPLGLIEVLESAGCYILDDDFAVGWRWFTEDVPETGDPVRSLAKAYLERSRASSVRHDPSRPRARALVERVRRAGAQAVIFMPAKFCEPALFDYVLYRRELDKENIPHLMVEFEEKMWTFERTRGEIETFVESLLFD